MYKFAYSHWDKNLSYLKERFSISNEFQRIFFANFVSKVRLNSTKFLSVVGKTTSFKEYPFKFT